MNGREGGGGVKERKGSPGRSKIIESERCIPPTGVNMSMF